MPTTPVVEFPFKIWELVRKAIPAEEADLVPAVLSLVVMHMAFVVSALMLTYIDKIAHEQKAAGH